MPTSGLQKLTSVIDSTQREALHLHTIVVVTDKFFEFDNVADHLQSFLSTQAKQ
jgi:hypothetical protein